MRGSSVAVRSDKPFVHPAGKRPVLSLTALLTLVPALLSQTPAHHPSLPSTDIPIKVDVQLVQLPITVTDRRGRAFTDLKSKNFRVLDNGQVQTIHHFSTEDVPFSMGLVLDRSGSMSEMIDDVYGAAFHTVTASKSEDEFFLAVFNQQYELRQEFSTNRDLLQRQLKGVRAYGNTALWDAIFRALKQVQNGSHEKKALLVVTDGADNNSALSFRDLLEEVRSQQNTIIYVVGLFGGMDRWSSRPERDDPVVTLLTRLAETTGGRAYFPRTMKECQQACIAIAEELRQQYSLAYYPEPRPVDGSWHAVEVGLRLPADLAGKGLIARTRGGYFAPQDKQVTLEGRAR